MFTERKKMRFGQRPNELLVQCLQKDDFTEWNEWRVDNDDALISLKGVRLGNANLAGIDLSRVDLKAADLKNTNLAGADFSQANLIGADLSHANLLGADLWKADLKYANLTQANLKSAHLVMANLENAELVGINLEGADMWKADLKGAKLVSVTADRRTFIWGCNFDERTVFHGSNLSLARIEPCLIEHMKSGRRASA